MKNKGTHFLVQGAAIAAIYVVLTLVFAPLSFGEVQIRFSEALTVLPVLHTGCPSRDCLWDVSLPIFLAVRFQLTSFSEALHTYRCILNLQASQYRQMDSPDPADRFQHCDRSSCASLRIWH